MLVPGGQLEGPGTRWLYVKPAIAEVTNGLDIVQHETFAPILYLMSTTPDEAMPCKTAWSGLSSAIMTNDIREAENFLSAAVPTAALPSEHRHLRRGNWRGVWWREINRGRP